MRYNYVMLYYRSALCECRQWVGLRPVCHRPVQSSYSRCMTTTTVGTAAARCSQHCRRRRHGVSHTARARPALTAPAPLLPSTCSRWAARRPRTGPAPAHTAPIRPARSRWAARPAPVPRRADSRRTSSGERLGHLLQVEFAPTPRYSGLAQPYSFIESMLRSSLC